ncbi:MAG TPA: ribonuclease PH [Myxococcota bacterium]|nr:ribonuclease PH [Myxococcota bacterium]HQK51818.1 ribonuclease PH [Myxococcota bacterium]
MNRVGRGPRDVREVRIRTGVQRDPAGSVEVTFGQTVVIVAATVGASVPPWLQGKSQGWVTAEYAMLPGATPERQGRVQKGRSEEIQRLVGRSLRAAVDLKALGERLVTVDCDVLQADGGTRCASITGGWVALAMACRRLMDRGLLAASPIRHQVCALSAAIVDGEVLVDPDYSEDHRAQADLNFVMTADGRLVEVQGTAEGDPFPEDLLRVALARVREALPGVLEAQRRALQEGRFP